MTDTLADTQAVQLTFITPQDEAQAELKRKYAMKDGDQLDLRTALITRAAPAAKPKAG